MWMPRWRQWLRLLSKEKPLFFRCLCGPLHIHRPWSGIPVPGAFFIRIQRISWGTLRAICLLWGYNRTGNNHFGAVCRCCSWRYSIKICVFRYLSFLHIFIKKTRMVYREYWLYFSCYRLYNKLIHVAETAKECLSDAFLFLGQDMIGRLWYRFLGFRPERF